MNTTSRATRRVLAATIALATLTAACGSDDDTTSDDGTTESSTDTGSTDTGSDTTATGTDDSADTGGGGDISEFEARVAEYQDPPTDINQTEALTAPLEPKKVTFIMCSDPTCQVLDGFLKEAITTLGWEYQSVSATATDPGAAVQAAIDTQPDFIAGTGVDIASFQPQMDTMIAAGIPYFSCYTTDIPGGEENNLYANCMDSSASNIYSRILADWSIVDTGGDAHAVVVGIPSFPILDVQSGHSMEAYAECETCSAQRLDLTIDDLTSGGVPNAIVSFLQSNEEINVVLLTFNGIDAGVAEAIDAAGMADRIKIIGSQATQPQLQQVIDGSEDAWTALPQEYAMWTLADQIARLSTGDWTQENERTTSPGRFYVVDTPEEGEAIVGLDNGWPGPENFKDQFKALWGV